MSNLLECAMLYAVAYEWAVIPCGMYSKRPLVKDWKVAATKDIKTIEKWWKKYPQANIGIHCGKSNLVVFDFDIVKHTFWSWNDVVARLALRDTLMSLTGNGGYHLFYMSDITPCLCRSVGIGVHIKMGDDWVIVPPSFHPNGIQYRWLNSNYISILPSNTAEKLSSRSDMIKRSLAWCIDRLVNH